MRSGESRRGPRGRLCAATAALFALATGGCMLVHSNDVAVQLRPVPPDARFVCVVADSGGAWRPMPWRIGNGILTTGTMHPAGCIHSWPDLDASGTHKREVDWQRADRVGVAWYGDDGWWVAWFDGPKARRSGWVPLVSGGEWTGNLAEADGVEALPGARVRELGLPARPGE